MIASVEQVEVGNLMELSVTGHVLRWARQSNFSGAGGWNMKNHSRQTVARHLREKTHTSLLILTLRKVRNKESAV